MTALTRSVHRAAAEPTTTSIARTPDAGHSVFLLEADVVSVLGEHTAEVAVASTDLPVVVSGRSGWTRDLEQGDTLVLHGQWSALTGADMQDWTATERGLALGLADRLDFRMETMAGF